MIISRNGDPLPPTEAVNRLAEVSPRLSLKFQRSAAGPYWALFEEWAEGYAGWEMVQRGQIPRDAARNLIMSFPSAMSPSEISEWVNGHYGPSASPTKKELAQWVEKNKKDSDDAFMNLVESRKEEIDHDTRNITSHDMEVMAGATEAKPMVSGYDFLPTAVAAVRVTVPKDEPKRGPGRPKKNG